MATNKVYDFRVIRFVFGESVFFCFVIRYLTDAAGFGDWNSGLHDLQLCFGVKDFLVRFKFTVFSLNS